MMMYCNRQEISVPGQLALIGFDNQPIAKMMGITTIEVNLAEAGSRLFIQAINEQTCFNRELPTKLIERETV
jgi:DNA-binding LacI/PurR family transcriptional regulator